MIKNIIEDFKEYFSEASIYLDMNLTDENTIRLGCSKTRVYLNLYWEDIFYLIDEEKGFEAILSFIYRNGRINKKSSIETLFGYISYEKLYSYHNKNLKIWGYKLNSFKDRYIQGFYKDNYAEFSIQAKASVGIEEVECNFQVGNVEVNISYPSDIYRLIFQSIKPLETFKLEWNNDITISFKKNDKSKLKLEEIEKYLQQSLFILNFYYPNIFIFGNSDKNYLENDINFKMKNITQVVESKHLDPIIYYNEGINSTEETTFYYYYKILEYYFTINIKDTMKKILEKEQENRINSNKDNIDCLIDKIISLSNNNKKMKLKNLLVNESIIEEIKAIINKYFYEENSREMNYYAEMIYKHRNSVIHSEDETRVLPQLLKSSNNYLSLEEWNEFIREIALICINYFSYDKKLFLE